MTLAAFGGPDERDDRASDGTAQNEAAMIGADATETTVPRGSRTGRALAARVGQSSTADPDGAADRFAQAGNNAISRRCQDDCDGYGCED